MKKLILGVAIASMASSLAFAQSSQGQAAGQAGVSGNATTAPDSTMSKDGMRHGSSGLTTGASRSDPNGSPTSAPKSPDAPSGKASEGQTAPK
ncbi:MAG TPA: hypothetical protein VE267_07695 [Bradyrhizobium sp.]|nr:hypothetical protein [Bradyrhizobium sp.]